jgi:integrase
MFLSKSTSGVYQLYYKDPAGHRQKVSTRTTSKIHAVEFLRTFDLEHAQATKPLRKRLKEFAEEFLEYARATYAPLTRDMYRRSIAHLQAQVGDKYLQEISPREIDLYKAKRLSQVRPASVNIELRCLKAAFNTSIRWKLLNDNPCAGIRMVPVPDQAPTFLTAEEFQQLISIMDEKWLQEVVLLAAVTGLRRGEIVNLRWTQVDLERRVLNIQSAGNFKTKKGRRRTVPLHSAAVILLKSKVGESADFVFTLKGKQLYEDWITRLFKRYVRKAPLKDKRIHFHSLRHSFASWLVQHGSSLYEVQRLLGHSSSITTQVYSHLLTDQMHDTVERIPMSLNSQTL